MPRLAVFFYSLLAALPSPLQSADGLPDLYASTALCALPLGNAASAGSAWVLDASSDPLWLVTCAHVVDRKSGAQVILYLWCDGQITGRLAGRVHWCPADPSQPDIALLSLPRSECAACSPVPLDFSRTAPARPGEIALNFGCPYASWPSATKGRVLSLTGQLLRHTPQPAEGRSGSALLDAAGRVIGLVTWRDPQTGCGVAQAWPPLLDYLRRRGRADARTTVPGSPLIAVSSPFPRGNLVEIPWYLPLEQLDPAQCPGGLCPLDPGLAARRPAPRPSPPKDAPPVPSAPEWPSLSPPAPVPDLPDPPPPQRRLFPFHRSPDPLPETPEAKPASPDPEAPAAPVRGPIRRAAETVSEAAAAADAHAARIEQCWTGTNRVLGRLAETPVYLAAVLAAYLLFRTLLTAWSIRCTTRLNSRGPNSPAV